MFLLGGVVGPVEADQHKVTMLEASVCASNPAIQQIRVRLDKSGENFWANCVRFDFLDASGSSVDSFVVPNDVVDGDGIAVTVGTAAFASATGTALEVVIPSGNIMAPNGQVCYRGIEGNVHPAPNEFACDAV